jgi:predicted enzyme related to lactoylglutathione lyase
VEVVMDGEKGYVVNEIGQIAIAVNKLDRAVMFYREKLGLRFLFQVPNMAFFDCAGVRLMLSNPKGSEEGSGNSILYFRVADIHESARLLADKGVAFKTEPHLVARMEDQNLWMAFFEDSEGNTLALMSEVREAAEG